MNYRTLGKTGLSISDVGIGTWQLANDDEMWVGADLQESLKSLYAFTELGGNFIDTAWVYGYYGDNQKNPTSEELIGKFLKESGLRKDLIIASKIAPKNWQWPAFKGTSISEVFPADHIQKLVYESLTRLGIETIDLMQFHVWQDGWADEDEWKEAAMKLTQEGKVRYWGISVNDYQPSNCLRTLEATDLISSIQFIFNIFHQKPIQTLLPYAKEHNIGLIARVPLDEGGLSGKVTRERNFETGDFRNNYFFGERRERLVERVDALKELVHEYEEVDSMVELALRFILSHEAISSVIPGMREVRYVTQNTSFSDKGPLSIELQQALSSHAWERNFYTGHDPALAESGFVEA